MNLRLIVLGMAFVGLSGCKVMYIPNMVNVPLMKEQNEFRTSIGINDYQFAYAPLKHIGLMANINVRNSGFGSSGVNGLWSTYHANRNLFEGGIGYFNPLPEGFIFEIYGGAGAGNIAFNQEQNDNSNTVRYLYSTKMTRLFLQPSFGFSNNFFDVSFSPRIIRLEFSDIQTENYSHDMLVEENLNGLDQSPFYFIEPTLTFRMGYKWAKFQVQAIYSNIISTESLNYQKFSFNVGLHFTIAKRYKGTKTIGDQLNNILE